MPKVMEYGSPIRIYRTTDPNPDLFCEINGNLFEDKSSDWEGA